ncbi:MAG: NTP transferase domain-containing protein, partial [Dichotomicrobium sp.]
SDLKRYGAIVLAAGLSRRLPGENKLLKTYRGAPLVAHALTTVASLGLGNTVVVTGQDAQDVAALASAAGLRCIHNPAASEGMGASLSAGAHAMSEAVAGVFIVLGDMPHITAEDYARLAAAHEAQPARICVPVRDGRRGHPVLFGRDYLAELAALAGDVGARGILRGHAARVVSVPAPSPGVLSDIDTAADFALEGAHSEPGAPPLTPKPERKRP